MKDILTSKKLYKIVRSLKKNRWIETNNYFFRVHPDMIEYALEAHRRGMIELVLHKGDEEVLQLF